MDTALTCLQRQTVLYGLTECLPIAMRTISGSLCVQIRQEKKKVRYNIWGSKSNCTYICALPGLNVKVCVLSGTCIKVSEWLSVLDIVVSSFRCPFKSPKLPVTQFLPDTSPGLISSPILSFTVSTILFNPYSQQDIIVCQIVAII